MPNSEESFIDRTQKGHAILNAVSGFTPAYSPPDNAINVAKFTLFMNEVDSANEAVATADTAYSNAVTTRKTASDAAQKLTTRVVNFVAAGPVWKLEFPRIKELADKVRRIKPPRKTPPPPILPPGTPPPPPEKPRDRGDGSYAEIAANFKTLAEAVNALVGYSAPGTDIDGPALTALAGQLEGNNGAVGTTDTALDRAQRARVEIFYAPESGLEDKFQAIKKAVKGQYGQSSTQYAQVKGIKW